MTICWPFGEIVSSLAVFGARNNVVVAWLEDALREDDVSRIVEVVRQEMGWLATA